MTKEDIELRKFLVEAMGDFPTDHLVEYHLNSIKYFIQSSNQTLIDSLLKKLPEDLINSKTVEGHWVAQHYVNKYLQQCRDILLKERGLL